MKKLIKKYIFIILINIIFEIKNNCKKYWQVLNYYVIIM